MSKLTQISLDFGPEERPSASTGDNGTGNDPARHYMAAGGVGVRVKSYKQTPASGGADLFGDTSAAPEQVLPELPLPEQKPAVAGEAAKTVTETPVEVELVTVQPVAVEPVAVDPVVVEPVEEEPVAEESWTAEPVAVETGAVKAGAAESVTEEPVREESVAGAVMVPAEEPALKEVVAEDAPLPKRQVSAKTSGARQKSLSPQPPSKRGRKSLKQVSAEADLIEIPVDEVLFSKQYYTMGEVSEMFRVNQSLLRFWESEFDVLQPRKNKKGDRYFRPVDIKNLHLIYHLLRQKKYTIEGAKEFLKKNKKADERFEVVKRLQEIKSFLLEMKAQL